MSDAAREELARMTGGPDPTERALAAVHPADRRATLVDLAEARRADRTDDDDLRDARVQQSLAQPTDDDLAWRRAAHSGSTLSASTATAVGNMHFGERGHATGVKGVIADAQAFERARRLAHANPGARITAVDDDGEEGDREESDGELDQLLAVDDDDDNDSRFLDEWRERRRKELERGGPAALASSSSAAAVKQPSARVFGGTLDEVDVTGYLDAIERVLPSTVVVVFVYARTAFSRSVERALLPIVARHATIRFVKVYYDDLDFDRAAVPALLAYRNQGEDLFANMTGLSELLPPRRQRCAPRARPRTYEDGDEDVDVDEDEDEDDRGRDLADYQPEDLLQLLRDYQVV